MSRRSNPDAIPEHYERLRLSAGARAALWAVAVALVWATLAAGLVSGRSAAGSAIGGLLALLAAAAVVAAVRLRACEVSVTRVSVRVGFGPFVRALPVWALHPGSPRPATGWRRAYARRELVVEADDPAGRRSIAIPTAQPDELASSLRAVAPSR